MVTFRITARTTHDNFVEEFFECFTLDEALLMFSNKYDRWESLVRIDPKTIKHRRINQDRNTLRYTNMKSCAYLDGLCFEQITTIVEQL